MLCPKCKNPIDDYATVCEWCGHIRRIPPPPPPSSPPSQTADTYYNTTRGGFTNNLYVRPVKPRSHLVLAIIALFLCCPLGIVSIFYAAKVNSAYNAGDFNRAISASVNAKTWAKLAIIGSICMYILYIISGHLKT